jgi:Bacterial Ig-like domain/Domain of unknown function (DUF4114)/FG-GAP-like repeat
MRLFKGFGQKKATVQKSAQQPESQGQTFMLEPMLTPSGLVDDPTQEVGLLDALHPVSIDPVPAMEQSWTADFTHASGVHYDEVPLIPSEEIQPIEFVDHAAFVETAAPYTAGVFTVGDTGAVRVDYLFDGGAYQGELALFNLQGMEHLEPGSQEFIQEAARRSLSGSEWGHVVISDAVDGAKFTGAMPGEGSFNSGDYAGAKTVQMAAGSQFGVMLVPHGTVQYLLDHPGDEAVRPLFSLSTANPNHGLQFGQIADVNGGGHTFAMEDLRIDGHSDRDYNDIVFRIDGATGVAPTLDGVMDTARDWRGTELGLQIAAAEPFNIELDFCQGFTPSQRAVIEAAARGVEALITQGLPDATIHGEQVDDLRIQLSLHSLDGDGGTLARTRLDVLRSDGSLLPIQALTQFDWADIAHLEQSGKLFDVMQHELLSALGFGTLWESKGLVEGNGTFAAQYVGQHGVAAFQELGGLTDGIPVEPNRLDAPALYWNERLFQDDLMTYDLAGQGHAALSPVTLASLQDLGYQVDLSKADGDYRLMGGMLAPRAELTEAQLAALADLKESMKALQVPISASVPGTSNDGWMYSSATALGNHAGQPNILWRNYSTGTNALWMMNGTTVQSYEGLPMVPPHWDLAGAADFNGDGKTDLVWRDRTEGSNGVWIMDGTDLQGVIQLPPVDPSWSIAGLGDFNQDQIPDLLWRSSDGNNGLWLMNRDGSVQSIVTLPTVGSSWWTGGVADFNGDGNPDILWRDYATGNNGVWLMNGTAISGTVSLPSTPDVNWAMRGVGDFNGDGNPDILWRNGATGANGLWLMNGTQLLDTRSLPAVTNMEAWVPVGTMSLFTPAPTGLALAIQSNTGATDDALTSINTPVITGQAMPGMVVRLYDQGNLVGLGRTNTNGVWQIQTQPLADGVHTLSATATDIFGLTSAVSQALEITIDTEQPLTPQIALDSASDTGVSNQDRVTNDTTPTLIGTAEPGSTVTLYRSGFGYGGSNDMLGQTTVGADGRWQFTSSPLADGNYSITAKATDVAANSSAATQPLSMMVDSRPPQLTLLNPTAGTLLQNNSRLVGNVQDLGSGIASFEYSFLGREPVPIALNQQGEFDQPIDFTGVFNGLQPMLIRATDRAGLQTTWQGFVQVFLDKVAPQITARLQYDTAPDGQTNFDSITNNSTIVGSVQDSSKIASFRVGFNTQSLADYTDLSALLQPNGSFTLDRSQLEVIRGSALTDGTYTLNLFAADEFGNHAWPLSLTFTLDSTAPAAPTLSLVADSDTGRSNSDLITKDSSPTLSGTTAPGTIIQLTINGTASPAIAVNADGTWQYTPDNLPNGSHAISVRATDTAGNVSAATNLSVTVDALLPTIDLTLPAQFDANSRLIGAVNGTGSAIASLTYRFNTGAEVAINPNLDGSFDQPLELGGLPSGTHTLTLTATDVAGNLLVKQQTVTVAPIIIANLVNDTAPAGASNTDGITSNPSVGGFVSDASRIVQFRAGFENTPTSNYVSILVNLQPDGSFELGRSQIESIYKTLNGNVSLPEGSHTFKLQAQDEDGILSQLVSVPFILDTTPPSLTVSNPTHQSALTDTSRLVGQVQDAQGIAVITYQFGNQAAIPVAVAADGSFNQPFDFAGVTNDNQQLTITSTDIAGNITRQTLTVTPNLTTLIAPIVTATLAIDSGTQDGITNNPTIAGTLDPTRATTLWATLGTGDGATSVNVTSLVTANGSFTLSPEDLAAVWGGPLPDGEQTLVLEPKDADGKAIASLPLQFTLDTTPPSVSVFSLLDGITWNKDAGELLEGEAFDELPGASVVYYFDGNQQQAIPLMMNGDGAFNRMVALNSLPLGEHTLTIRATDKAGNQQSIPYSFQLSEDNPATDPEIDRPDTPPPSRTNRGGSDWPNFGFDADGGGGGGWGWGWTYGSWGTGGGGGTPDPGFWSPPAAGGGYGTPEPTIPYPERIRVAVETAVKAMPLGSRRAALRERKAVLVETARQIDAPGNQFYDRFQNTLYGIYYLAGSIRTESQAKNLGHYLASQLNDPNDPAVRVQTFQQNLLTAVDDVLQQSGKLQPAADYPALEQAVMRMAYTYSLYNPAKIPVSTDAAAAKPDFMNRLWAAQNEYQADQLDDGIANLKTYLQGVNEPTKALQFVSNLLLAAKQVVSIQQDLKDPLFFQELLKFGFEYAKLNPDTSLSTEPQGFLDALWRAQSGTQGFAQAIKTGANGLSDLFEEADSKEKRLKRFKFANHLIESAQQIELLQPKMHEPALLNKLIALSGEYAALKTEMFPEHNQEPDEFFLVPASSLSAWAEVYTFENGTGASDETDEAINFYLDSLLWEDVDVGTDSTEIISGEAEVNLNEGEAILLAAAGSSKKIIQTSFGEFSMDKSIPRVGTGQTQNHSNVEYEVQLRFKPNQSVNATKIAMVQTIRLLRNNTPDQPSQEQRNRQLLQSEGTAGVAIDRYSSSTTYISPYYGTDNAGAALINARFGSRTPNSAPVDAVIADIPRALDFPNGDSLDYTFETYAIAVSGKDKGKYYGSVSWGFTFSQGKITEKPLKLGSKGSPTADFKAAARKWNNQRLPINGVFTPTIPLPLY